MAAGNTVGLAVDFSAINAGDSFCVFKRHLTCLLNNRLFQPGFLSRSPEGSELRCLESI